MSEDAIPSLKVIVVEVTHEAFTNGRFIAYVASNPDLAADGFDFDDAVDRLRFLVTSKIVKNRSSVKVIDMILDDLIVEEVHGS